MLDAERKGPPVFVPPPRPPGGLRRPRSLPWLLLAAGACLLVAVPLRDGAAGVALGAGLAVLAAAAVVMARAYWAAADPDPDPAPEPRAVPEPDDPDASVDLAARLRQLHEDHVRRVDRALDAGRADLAAKLADAYLDEALRTITGGARPHGTAPTPGAP